MKFITGILVSALMVLGLAACGEPAAAEPEYMGVCVDPNTEERLEDDACQEDDSDFLMYAVLWYMLASSNHGYPAVGDKVNRSHYVTKLPKGKTYKTGLSKKGGTSVKSYVVKKYSNPSGGSGYNKPKSGGSGFKPSGGGGGFKSGGRR